MNFKQWAIALLLPTWVTTVQAGYLSNFNEPNTSALVSAIQQQHVHIVQFGDSHTAADVMTDQLRQVMQQRLGNGGMGWGMPMFFSGQRLARYGYDKNGFVPISSRTRSGFNYTLGGFLAVPQQDQATLTIKAKKAEATQRITVSIRQESGDGDFSGVDANGKSFRIAAPYKDGTWQTVQFTAKLPFTIRANQAEHSAIGGWWAENANGKGAVVSALGINGAEISYWQRWNSQWHNEMGKISPNLVILAYGTNEAYNDADVDRMRQNLVSVIRQIRQASPSTAVMIVSAPESLKSLSGQCGVRPSRLTDIQRMQKQVAQQQHTLYWDWQQMMGGNCSMKAWINQGLARGDGVHFTATGYQRIGSTLANDLLALSGATPSSSPNHQQYDADEEEYTPTSHPIGGGGYAKICSDDGCKIIRY